MSPTLECWLDEDGGIRILPATLSLSMRADDERVIELLISLKLPRWRIDAASLFYRPDFIEFADRLVGFADALEGEIRVSGYEDPFFLWFQVVSKEDEIVAISGQFYDYLVWDPARTPDDELGAWLSTFSVGVGFQALLTSRSKLARFARELHTEVRALAKAQ